jgi:hypothetical protein
MDYSRYNDDSSTEGGASSNRMMRSGAAQGGFMMREYEPVVNRTFGAERTYKQRLILEPEDRSEKTRATRKIHED